MKFFLGSGYFYDGSWWYQIILSLYTFAWCVLIILVLNPWGSYLIVVIWYLITELVIVSHNECWNHNYVVLLFIMSKVPWPVGVWWKEAKLSPASFRPQCKAPQTTDRSSPLQCCKAFIIIIWYWFQTQLRYVSCRLILLLLSQE